MMTPTEYDAHCLHDAIVGLGTTESVLIGILSTRKPQVTLPMSRESHPIAVMYGSRRIYNTNTEKIDRVAY